MATTSTSDSSPWTTRRVRDRWLGVGVSWSAVTGALAWQGQRARRGRAGSSSRLRVKLKSSLGALAGGGLDGELPVGVGGQVQPADHATTGELVVPGGRELAGGRLELLVVPHARGR